MLPENFSGNTEHLSDNCIKIANLQQDLKKSQRNNRKADSSINKFRLKSFLYNYTENVKLKSTTKEGGRHVKCRERIPGIEFI